MRPSPGEASDHAEDWDVDDVDDVDGFDDFDDFDTVGPPT
jgi:hypothetical protein